VQPAASDRGLALGSALQAAFDANEAVRPLAHVFLGPEYSDTEIRRTLDLAGLSYRAVDDPAAEAAGMLAAGEIIGWFQGRSELGPRALGNRSILADPRPAGMKDAVNARVKFREEFRPFAPAVLEERAGELFELTGPSPYMTVAYRVRPAWRPRIPAVVHVNGTARVQTVDRGRAPLFYRLIERFAKKTGVPAILNTSFNLRGQPIVETPRDALATFAACGLSAVFLGRFLVVKPRQPAAT
jgi:carbamoyltransferase